MSYTETIRSSDEGNDMGLRTIPDKESLTVEFKSDRKRLPDSDLIDAVVALSNTDGGFLYIGVEDDGTPTGVHRAHSDPTQLAAFIANKTVPPVGSRVETLSLDNNGATALGGMRVVQVEVPKSKAIVASSDGKVLRRRLKADGSPESAPLYPYEIITRLSAIGQLDYSAFPVPDTSIQDFSLEEVQHLRTILGNNKGGDMALLELDDAELLAALHMTTRVDGKATPTITGILLAGKPDVIARAIPTAKSTFQVLEGTEVRVNRDLNGPLLQTIDAMRDMLEPWNPEREVEDGLFRKSVPEFDRRAFREAVVNAFGHRDYAAMGRVRVLVSDEGLTVSNPGGFVEGVTVDNILTVEPHGRNECLMDALKRIGLAERTARGIDRIFEGSLAYGRPLPDYSGTTSSDVVLFVPRSAPDEAFMKMLADEQARAGKPLSLWSLLVLNALKTQRRLGIADLAEQIHRTAPSTRATVELLVEAGLVEAHGSSSARTYMLSGRIYGAAGKEADFVRQSDIDSIRYPELIVKLARQQGGRVTNRDVMKLLRLNRKQAYRQLKKIVEDGRLEPRGAGRSSHYVLPS